MAEAETAATIGLATLLDSLLEGVQVIGPDFRYLYVNAAAAQHGHRPASELLGRTMMDCFPGIEQSELFVRLRAALERHEPSSIENEFRYADGSAADFELRIEPVPHGVCVLSIDISARKRAEASLRASEERLRHAERMDAVGMLAAGIAHDFNNLLSVILGYGENALTRPSGPRRDDIESIIAAARRSAELTRQLLAYGRRQVMRSEVVDPVALVSDLESLLRPVLQADIELSLQVASGVGCIEVDPTQLEQVVMNLVLNARDALPRGGKIAIGLEEVDVDEGYAQRHPGAQLGPHIVLSVSDSGTGMDSETQARIFEPFFTTKAQGKGTGLGLATAYGIVKQSGGNIWVYSELGRGTTFKVYLPRSARAQGAGVPSRDPPKRRSVPSTEGTVLVAEDDPMLRTLAEDTLIAAGYHVLLAASGDEALRLCDSQRPVTLLMTDVVMPGLQGPELVVAARRLRPDLKVLCTSGHASAALKDQRHMPGDVVFLEKPYLPSALVRTVREMLAGVL